MTDFASLGLPTAVARALAAAGFDVPLPVQVQAIPALLDGRHLVVSAETGSGKTLAYLAPLLAGVNPPPPQKKSTAKRRKTTRKKPRPGQPRGPQVLVLAPTRELAAQIRTVAETIGAPLGVRTALVHGGVGFGPQADALSGGAEIIVATPGRLRDHIQRGNGDLSVIRAVVLDEADRMLEMGFSEDVRFILAALPASRQTALCSATIDARVGEFVAQYLSDAVHVSLGESEGHTLPAGLNHQLARVRQPLKRLLLVHLLTEHDWPCVVVFVKTRFRCQALAGVLNESGVPAEPLHADLKQHERGEVLDRFRAGATRVLIATDLAERGLDVPRITHVINFDPPNTAEIYVHRVGRTARLFGEGTAITFTAGNEDEHMEKIAGALALDLSACDTGSFRHAQRPEGLDPLIEPLRTRPRKGAGDAATPSAPRRRLVNPEREQREFWARVKDRKTEKKKRKGKLQAKRARSAAKKKKPRK